jgi:hypothetical protein
MSSGGLLTRSTTEAVKSLVVYHLTFIILPFETRVSLECVSQP